MTSSASVVIGGEPVDVPLDPLHAWGGHRQRNKWKRWNGATLQVLGGREHFERRRVALEALRQAGTAVGRLVELGGYPRDQLIPYASYIGGVERAIAGMLPEGRMPTIAALLSDERRTGPRSGWKYRTWSHAESDALRMFAPDVDAPTLAAADGKGRAANTFKKKRRRRARR